jgi:FtsP/CotA-like multicopper oxidase with cupredoxin domain
MVRFFFRLVLSTLVVVGEAHGLTRTAEAAALVEPPVVHTEHGVAQLTLFAVQNGKTGLPAFSFDNGSVPPTIRVNPGDHIKIHYVNALPVPVHQPFMNMTNLHFHGMKTSPNQPGDDVVDTLLLPGQSYDYDVFVPKDEAPGLYWYHPHAHGESNRQVSGGMSGLIIVNGIEKYYPQMAHVPEQVLIMRDNYSPGYPVPAERQVRSSARRNAAGSSFAPICSGSGSENVTLNGAVRPSISIRPGETQFWRFANASANTFADLQVDGAKLAVIARDGEPIDSRDRSGAAGVMYDHYLVPPAGRVEFLVTGPNQAGATFRSLCVNTGPTGNIMPNRVLADIDPTKSGAFPLAFGASDLEPTRKPAVDIRSLPIANTKTIVFTENQSNGQYFINGQLYDPDAPPHYFAKAGTVEAWTIVNKTTELHAFHIHQIHFLVLDGAKDAARLPEDFRDTIAVPFETFGAHNTPIPGKVHLLMDFTDPIIRGTFVFHCHILEHEDGGMMQKITVR